MFKQFLILLSALVKLVTVRRRNVEQRQHDETIRTISENPAAAFNAKFNRVRDGLEPSEHDVSNAGATNKADLERRGDSAGRDNA